MEIYNQEHLETVGKIVRAINHPMRIKIIEMLSEKEMPVTDIYVKLRVEQSVCSQQLSIMRAANVVVERRRGKFKFYSLNLHYLEGLNAALAIISNL